MFNLNDEITIINNDCLEVKQPEIINIKLKPHQLKLIYRCLELENNNIIDNNISINTSIGIIGDSVGSGKSYVILSIMASNKDNNNTLNLLATVPLFTIYKTINDNLIYKDINILVVPHNIFTQWKGYINNTNFTVEYIYNIKQFNNIQFDKQIILLSSSLYNKFADLVNKNHYIFSRIFYDEADSIKIPNCKEIKSYFYWFITSSIYNLLLPNGLNYWQYTEQLKELKDVKGINHKGFIKNMFNNLYSLKLRYQIAYTKYLFLKNDDELIKKSFLLPEPIIQYIRCKNTNIINILSDLIPNRIQRMIFAGDINSAINEINCKKTTEINLIKLVANDLLNELSNKEIDLESIQKKSYKDINKKIDDINKIQNEINIINTKIQNIKDRMNKNNIDPITYEEIKNIVVLNCCKQIFDFESITRYISALNNNAKCPMCRAKINNDNLILVDNNTIDDIINDDLTSLDKNENLNFLLQNNINKNARILIFSEFSNTWGVIDDVLKQNHINYKELKGNTNVINNIINWYKDNINEQKVLLLNAKYYGSGLNLENTTDVILYHQMDLELEKQVIGRAQRFGRKDVLKIWKLLYENE